MAQIIKNDDCLSVLKTIPDEYFDCLVTDPPYNVDYTGKQKSAMKIENDSMANDEFYNFLLSALNLSKRSSTSTCRNIMKNLASNASSPLPLKPLDLILP